MGLIGCYWQNKVITKEEKMKEVKEEYKKEAKKVNKPTNKEVIKSLQEQKEVLDTKAQQKLLRGRMKDEMNTARGQLMKDIGIAAMRAIQSLASIPYIGWGLGIVAAGTAVALGMKYMSDGMIGPGGETIVSGPKGSIQLDKDDSMVVGTNLDGGGGSKPNPIAERRAEEQLQQSKTQNQLLSQLIGNTNKLKDLDNVSFYEIQ